MTGRVCSSVCNAPPDRNGTQLIIYDVAAATHLLQEENERLPDPRASAKVTRIADGGTKECGGTECMLTASNSRTLFHVQTYVVTLLVAFSVMSYFDRTIMSIAAPVIMKEFSLSETSMGAVFSAFQLSYALMNLPGGHLADRFGPRLVLTITNLGAAVFTGMTALCGRPGLGTYL